MQPQTDSRQTTSCTECQRRKQKCSREWPCNHCQTRKVPHLCQFAGKKTQQESPIDASRDSSSDGRGRKRSAPDLNEPRSRSLSQNIEDEPQDGLKIWGYMPGHVHYKVGHSEDIGVHKSSLDETASLDAVENVVHALPPRSITDAIVNHFLTVVNYRYTVIYGPTLAEQYVQWWTDRGTGKRLSPGFTCLLLRICAYSVQCLTPTLRKMIEFELACSSHVITERFADAAEQLSRSVVASDTSIERIQEQFLKCAWLKAESKIVESWHALGCTIREAQELGIDKDVNSEELSEFDIEIRRRIWVVLYVWDWQMSAWLGRPILIDQKNLDFELPNLRLDESTTDPRVLSPFAHMSLQAQLGRKVAAIVREAPSADGLSAKQVLDVEIECEKFMDGLPAIFRVKNPDKSLDEQYPYFVFQRLQMYCVIFITMLHVFKPYLTRERDGAAMDQDDEFRKMGVDVALRLFQVSRNLFDLEYPISAKFHVVVFSLFDTATLLCSAVIHDREHVLHRREEVTNLIEGSLDMLRKLSQTTKLATASYNFLAKLVQATPILSRQSPTTKRRRGVTTSLPPPTPPMPIVSAPIKSNSLPDSTHTPFDLSIASGSETTSNSASAIALSPSTTTADNLSFDIDNFLANHPFENYGNPSSLDMGGMEQIWDWEDLRLDSYSQQDPHI